MIKLEPEKKAMLDKLLGVANVDKIFKILTDIKTDPESASHDKIDSIVNILENKMPNVAKKYHDLTTDKTHITEKLEILVYTIKSLTAKSPD